MSEDTILPVVVVGIHPDNLKPESDHSLFVFLTAEKAKDPNNWPKNVNKVYLSGSVKDEHGRKEIWNFARNELGAHVLGTQSLTDFKLIMKGLIDKAEANGFKAKAPDGGGKDDDEKGKAGGGAGGDENDPHVPKRDDPAPRNMKELVRRYARLDTPSPSQEAQRLLEIAKYFKIEGKQSSVTQLIFQLRREGSGAPTETGNQGKGKKQERKRALSLRLAEILGEFDELFQRLQEIMPEVEQIEAENLEAGQIRAQNAKITKQLEHIRQLSNS